MKSILKFSIILFFTFLYTQAGAQDFKYKPTNPAFGGDTFNYNWLMSSAQSQNNTKEKQVESSDNIRGGTALDNFSESLNRQILNQLSRSLLQNQFGEGGLEEGEYSIGEFEINVEDVGDGLSVTIFDGSTGSDTQIIIPYF